MTVLDVPKIERFCEQACLPLPEVSWGSVGFACVYPTEETRPPEEEKKA